MYFLYTHYLLNLMMRFFYYMRLLSFMNIYNISMDLRNSNHISIIMSLLPKFPQARLFLWSKSFQMLSFHSLEIWLMSTVVKGIVTLESWRYIYSILSSCNVWNMALLLLFSQSELIQFLIVMLRDDIVVAVVWGCDACSCSIEGICSGS